jgi:hypothetical protein
MGSASPEIISPATPKRRPRAGYNRGSFPACPSFGAFAAMPRISAALALPALAVIALAVFALALSIGSVAIDPVAVLHALFASGDETQVRIVRELRLPRALAAFATVRCSRCCSEILWPTPMCSGCPVAPQPAH